MALIKKNHNFHILSLSIFSIYYLFSLITFKEIVIFPYDTLEMGVVIDHVISRMFRGDYDSYKVFLSGEFKWFYLDRIFYPTNLVHIFLNDKQFYFFYEIVEKLISYFSFYLLGKFLFKNKVNSIFGAIFYTTLINDVGSPAPTIFLPVMPYLLYLACSKNQLRLKHLIILFFIGLSSSLVLDYPSMILMIIFAYFIRSKKNYIILFNVLVTISLGMVIAGIPLILSVLDEPLHRAVMEKKELLTVIIFEFKNFYSVLNPNSIRNIFLLPTNILKILILIYCLLTKNKEIRLFLLFFLSTYLLRILLTSDLTQIIFNNFLIFLKGFGFSRVDKILPLLFSIVLVAILNINKKKLFRNAMIILTFVSSICLQLYLPAQESVKKLLEENLKKESLEQVKKKYIQKNFIEIISTISDKNNYKQQNLIFDIKTENTFDSYYKLEVYKKIKLLVGSNRVASIGVDPMIAVMNDINVIDGYHNIYHLSYKKKFRGIIKEELNQNNILKDYYDNWGNKVYLFYNDKNNLLINFKEAKNLGAEYIISSFPLKNKNLESNYLLYNENDKIYLYKII
jgi:hypothetical protein